MAFLSHWNSFCTNFLISDNINTETQISENQLIKKNGIPSRPKIPLLFSGKPATGPCHAPYEFILHSYIQFLQNSVKNYPITYTLISVKVCPLNSNIVLIFKKETSKTNSIISIFLLCCKLQSLHIMFYPIQ